MRAIDDENIKRDIMTLDTISIKLHEYCHSSSCERVMYCPADCKQCSKSLRLDTALAWTVGRSLRTLAKEVIECDVDAAYVLQRASTLFYVVSQINYAVCLHEDRYKRLSKYLAEAVTTLVKLIDSAHSCSRQVRTKEVDHETHR